MKKGLTLKKQIFFMTIAPMMLAMLLLTIYFFFVRMEDLEKNLHTQGESMIKQLAQAGRYPIATSNIEELFELTKLSLIDNHVDSVAIFDKDKNVLAFNGLDKNYLASEQDLKTIKQNTKHVLHHDDNVDFLAPIIINSKYLTKYHLKLLSLDDEEIKEGTVIGWVAVNLSYTGLYFQKYQTISALFLILLFSCLISLVFATHLANHILLPFRSITTALKKIAKGEKPALQISSRNDELCETIKATNDIAKNIETSKIEFQENLDQATQDMQENFETIERQNIQLSVAQKKALKASSIKSEFISNISHEIRTPMNSVYGFTKLLLNSSVTSMQRDYLTTIAQASENLLVLINNVLDFSKIESGKLRLEQVPMNLRSCIEDVLLTLSHPAQSKQIELTHTFHDEVPTNIIGDPLRLKQILTNILGNAIKFTDAGSIIVRTILENKDEKEAEICISITDTGSGLSKTKQDMIFKAFNQTNPTISTEFGNTGLGLIISKQLLDQMRGRITLESQEDKGSTFLITFICKTIGEIPNKSQTKIDFKGMKVLVHEQHPITRYSVMNQLGKWNLDCDETTCEAEAISKSDNADNYNLIVLGMHQAENFLHFNDSVLRYFKNKAPILVLTNSNEQHLSEDLTQAGVNACISKPILQHALLDRVKQLLTKQAQNDSTKTQTTPDTPLPLQACNILTIDDNMHNNQLVKTMLERLGATVTVAEDGNYGVLLASKHPYDIILMDLRMPNLDGFSATKLIRKTNCLNYQKPIIAVSAHISAVEKPELIGAGFTDYLTKPIIEDLLLNIILQYLNKPSTFNAASLEKEAQTNLIKSNEHIDIELGKKLAGGNEQLALEMFEMLSESIPEDISEIEKAYEEKAYKNLLDLIHRFHGAVCYAGTPRLKHLTEDLETKLKTNQLTAFDKQYVEFIEEINTVQIEIKKINKTVAEDV